MNIAEQLQERQNKSHPESISQRPIYTGNISRTSQDIRTKLLGVRRKHHPDNFPSGKTSFIRNLSFSEDEHGDLLLNGAEEEVPDPKIETLPVSGTVSIEALHMFYLRDHVTRSKNTLIFSSEKNNNVVEVHLSGDADEFFVMFQDQNQENTQSTTLHVYDCKKGPHSRISNGHSDVSVYNILGTKAVITPAQFYQLIMAGESGTVFLRRTDGKVQAFEIGVENDTQRIVRPCTIISNESPMSFPMDTDNRQRVIAY